MNRPARTTEALLHFWVETATADELIEWAVRALADGYESPALVRLASLADVRLSDATPVFLEALRELGIELLSREETARSYATEIAARICSGELEPRLGAYRIFREVLQPMLYPGDLMSWYFLYDGTHYPTRRELEGSELDAVILEEARKLAARNS